MGIPTSGLFVGYIGEIINSAVGSPLGEWGGWKVGFVLSELTHIAAFYGYSREQHRQFDSRRWQLPH